MGSEMLGMPSRFRRELPPEALEAPIRWGSELYQAGMGIQGGARMGPRGGGAHVAGELQRIRTLFDRARSVDTPAEASPAASESPESPTAWAKGTRVRSPRFGVGLVLGHTGSGDGLTYSIRFATGEKRIVARFGMLEAVEN